MSEIVRELGQIPLIPRYMVIGSVSLGVPGAIFGLVVGLGDPSTAWFALFEGGVLAGAAGAVIGLLAGVVAYLSTAVARLIKG